MILQRLSVRFRSVFYVPCALAALAAWQSAARADFPILGFDTYMVQKVTNREAYGALATVIRADPNSPDPENPNELPGGPMPGILYNDGFRSFEVYAQIVSDFGNAFDLTVGGGVGGRFYEGSGVGDPAGVNHDVYGTSFNPDDYQIEVTYKLGAHNEATRFDVAFDQHDGYADGNLAGSQSQGEQFSYEFTDIVNRYASEAKDADGFVTLRRNLTELPNPVTGDPSIPWDSRVKASNFTNDGDSMLDWNAFQGGVRNGIRRIQLKSIAGPSAAEQDILDISVKSVKVVPKVAVPEVARIDGNTGFSTGFKDTGGQNIVSRANGNLVLDFIGSSGAQINQVATHFDATQYGVEVTAKLLAGTTSSSFRIVAKDIDGNDTAPSQGAEEWALSFNTSDFNQSTFTTIVRPWSEALAPTQAFGFANAGDGLLTDFDLFQFQVANNGAGSALKLEVQSIKVVPLSTAPDGDYDNSNFVDGADFLVWQRGGSPNGPTAGDLAAWQAAYGAAPAVATVQSLPEPAGVALWAAAAAAVLVRRGVGRMSLVG